MKTEVPYGYCQCGCGELAPVAKQTRKDRGFKQGEPQKFIKGHMASGEDSPTWKGGGCRSGIYPRAYAPDHPDAVNHYVLEHRFIAEKPWGKRYRPMLMSTTTPLSNW